MDVLIDFSIEVGKLKFIHRINKNPILVDRRRTISIKRKYNRCLNFYLEFFTIPLYNFSIRGLYYLKVDMMNKNRVMKRRKYFVDAGKFLDRWKRIKFLPEVLFVLLTLGLLFKILGHGKVVEFGNMQTSDVSIYVHTIIYFVLFRILLIAIGIHIYTG